jgi:activator of HSP90 ATPase
LKSELPKDQIIKDVTRSTLLPKLRAKIVTLAPALIAEHGKDIQHQPGQGPPTGFEKSRVTSTTQISNSSSKSSASASASATQTTSSGEKVRVTSLKDSSEYRTSAEELFKTFTDPQRIAAFTRSPPKVFDGPKVGGKFELFGGNVSGSFESLEAPTKIVQKWRLAQWPAGHYSTQNIEFKQNNEDHVTVMDVDWQGVPVGQEEVTQRNWREYYVRSIKTTFGFGTVL